MKGVLSGRIPEGKPGAGIRIIRLHYTADPTMTPERVANEKAKCADLSLWNQDMEIDAGARRGQLIFPNFDPAVNVIPRGDWLPLALDLKPDFYTIWLSCDPHSKTPDAFLWLAVDKEKDLHVVWSLWAPEKLAIEDVVREIRLIEDSLRIESRYFLMDSAGQQWVANEKEKINWFDRYRQCGLHFRPAKKNVEYVGYTLINEALAAKSHTIEGKEVQSSRLMIWDEAGDNAKLVGQLKTLRWKQSTTETRDAPEEPEQRERHLVDCLSYIMLDDPHFVPPRRRDRGGGCEPIYPGAFGGTGY